jgi:copper homeostasis protein
LIRELKTWFKTFLSGGNPTAIDSLSSIRQLLADAPSHLTIMVGSGVSPESVSTILTELSPYGLRELHMSGGEWKAGEMIWKRAGMGMGAVPSREWDVWRSSTDKIQIVRKVLDAL